MTILEINNYFYRRGGSETALFETMRALEERGHRVIPFAMADTQNVPTEFASFFPKRPPRWQFWKRLYNRDVRDALEHCIRETNPDVAHLHNIAYHLTASVTTALSRNHIPVVRTLHDFQAMSALPLLYGHGRIMETDHWGSSLGILFRRAVHGSFLASFAAVFARSTDRLFLRQKRILRWLAPSLFMANLASRYGLPEEHITLVHHSQDIHHRCQQIHRTSFVYVGRLTQEKGVEQLIKWWAKLPPSYTLLIVGSGPEEQRLRVLARRLNIENIRWFGAYKDQEMLGQILEGARALLVPSQWYENAPYVILEAFAHATPVIAADIGGIPELVESTRGWLVPVEAMAQWLSTIRWVAEHPDDAKRRGQAAYAWLKENRTRRKYAFELEAVLGEAVVCSRAPRWCQAVSSEV